MSNDQVTSVSLDLSHEEVWALLRILDLPDLPGWKRPQTTEELAPYQLAGLRSAENSLIARGLLTRTIEDPRDKLSYGVDQLAAVLVGAGVIAKQVLVLIHQTDADTVETQHIYFTDTLTVMHTRKEIGAQRFLVLNGGEMLLSALLDSLNLPLDSAQRPADAPVALTQEAFKTARAIGQREGSDACATYLAEISLPDAFHASLAQAFSHPIALDRILLADKDSDQPQALVVFQVDDGCWLVASPAADEDERVVLEPANSAEVTGRITAMLNQ